jgi:hypothetical protein
MKQKKGHIPISEEIDPHLKPGQDYEYEDSGIVERVGIVPLWLQAVYVSLVIWAVYYIVRYWGGE